MDSKSSTAFPMEQPAIRRRGAVDHISGLPDELLHTILVRLPSAAAAARTSVLSRRWRGVWAHMPELVLCGSPGPSTPPSALLHSIDAALNSYAAPTLSSLKIQVIGADKCDVPAHRISRWLRFASHRIAGKLHIRLLLEESDPRCRDTKQELALPICERATEIHLSFGVGVFLRPPPTGSFSALTYLRLSCEQMDGGELGHVVSSPQCPRLRKLYIFVSVLAPLCNVSICSESLECLDYTANTGKLEVNAPMLQEISVSYRVGEACIVAPKLEMVRWIIPYNPGLHQFAVSGRHLQSLYIMHSSFLVGVLISSTKLLEKYDSAKELIVSLGLYQEIAGYTTFLQEMDKLPICESLVINFLANHHALSAMMFHLLRRCSCIRKLKLSLAQISSPKVTSCSVSGCPCLLPENYRLDGITFDSLEEIGIKFFTGSDEEEEFMKLLLSKCNMVTLKRVDIKLSLALASSEIKEVVERIRSVCHPNSKIQFNIHPKLLVS